VACLPSFEHPVLLLGQPVVMGHDGHLFSQGLDYGPVLRKLETLMDGGDGWRQAARDLRVQYLLWGRREEERWPRSAQPWRDCAYRVGDSPYATLYLITPCLLQD